MIISRFLANFVEHRITPNINKIAASKLVANKDVLIELENQNSGEVRNFRRVGDYSMPNVSEKVVRIIISYVDYIKRTVWAE